LISRRRRKRKRALAAERRVEPTFVQDVHAWEYPERIFEVVVEVSLNSVRHPIVR